MTTLDHQALREQVAACTLLLNDLDILGYSGHVSARLPDGQSLLIQSYEDSRAALAPAALLVCDLDGRMVSGTQEQRPPYEIFLHSEIYKARPDVHAIAHFHHDRTTVFTLTDAQPLVPVKTHAVRWASGIPVHGNLSLVNSAERGQALAATLGPHHAALIRAHGQVVTAENIPALLLDSIHLIENAEALYDAAVLGRVKPLTPEEMETFSKDLKRDRHVGKMWKYYVGRARAKGILPLEWRL
jgi:ribulose-5-phosphate 4-epimerase/fuculose-1-phosphate aldolase